MVNIIIFDILRQNIHFFAICGFAGAMKKVTNLGLDNAVFCSS